jgi:hypothetical protein
MADKDDDLTRIQITPDEEMKKKIRKIQSLGIKYPQEAIRMAVFHLADHIENDDFKK